MALRRRRETIGPREGYVSRDVVVRLDRVPPQQVAAEALNLGFVRDHRLTVPETEEYLGSTVVVLRGP